ncbi:DNA repair protein RecO [Thermogemmatispora onikobensis]|uniref:DNA repair protein RecO n=1 Tax=Thermogemmatispora onikobensis TaxID=732234 RepID=UPI0008539610|nr:DNA repair protein RecO [Thermogemmatispora onikobensis]
MRQQRSYSTRAIVLRRINLGEADRIVTLLTPTHGKMQAVAKGIRRPTSKLAGHLELLCHSQLQLALGRDLDIVTQAESRESFLDLRMSQWHMTCGFYLAELVDRFLEEHTQQSRVYFLMLEMLRALDADAAHSQKKQSTGQADDSFHTLSQLLLRYFEIHLLSQVGYEPAFRACAHCAAELRPEQNGFSPSLGGALCPRCSRLWTRPLSVKALHVLRVLQRSEWQAVPHWRLNAPLLLEIERVMHDLLRFHLERDLKTWSFLEMLRLERNLDSPSLPTVPNL